MTFGKNIDAPKGCYLANGISLCVDYGEPAVNMTDCYFCSKWQECIEVETPSGIKLDICIMCREGIWDKLPEDWDLTGEYKNS